MKLWGKKQGESVEKQAEKQRTISDCTELYDQNENIFDNLKKYWPFPSVALADEASIIDFLDKVKMKGGLENQASLLLSFVKGIVFLTGDNNIDHLEPIFLDVTSYRTRTVRASWMLGSWKGAFNLFFFVRGQDRQGSANDCVFAIANEQMTRFDLQKFMDVQSEIRIYASCYEFDDCHCDELRDTARKIDLKVVKYRQSIDSIFNDFLKNRKTEWQSRIMNITEYICECVRYPALFVCDVIDNFELALAVSIGMTYPSNLNLDQSALDKTISRKINHEDFVWSCREYAYFLFWVYAFMRVLELYERDMSDIETSVEECFLLLPYRNKYIVAATVELMTFIFRNSS